MLSLERSTNKIFSNWVRAMFVITCVLPCAVLANEKYATQNSIYKQVVLNPSKYNGELLSFGGRITKYYVSSGNRFVHLNIQIEGSTKLLISPTLFEPMNQYPLKIGQKVRVLGIWSPIDFEEKNTKDDTNPYHLIVFCIVSEDEAFALFHEEGVKQCSNWAGGAASL